MTRFNLQFILQMIHASDPSDTALAIITGGATRQREVFYPYIEAKATILRDLLPETFAYINRYMYSKGERDMRGLVVREDSVEGRVM